MSDRQDFDVENKGSKPAEIIERGQQAAASRAPAPEPMAQVSTTPPPAPDED